MRKNKTLRKMEYKDHAEKLFFDNYKTYIGKINEFSILSDIKVYHGENRNDYFHHRDSWDIGCILDAIIELGYVENQSTIRGVVKITDLGIRKLKEYKEHQDFIYGRR